MGGERHDFEMGSLGNLEGRAAREVIEQPYEELLRCDVRLVRARLGIPDPQCVHPEGIPIGPFFGEAA